MNEQKKEGMKETRKGTTVDERKKERKIGGTKTIETRRKERGIRKVNKGKEKSLR